MRRRKRARANTHAPPARPCAREMKNLPHPQSPETNNHKGKEKGHRRGKTREVRRMKARHMNGGRIPSRQRWSLQGGGLLALAEGGFTSREVLKEQVT